MTYHIKVSSIKRKQAFTLIELLAVIAIIAILFSVLMAALGAARSRSQNVVCLNNLRSLSVAVLLYANENGGRLPSPLGTDSNGWESLIAPYLGYEGTDVPMEEFRCPSDPKPLDDGAGNFARSYLFSGLLGRSLDQQYGLVTFSIPTSDSDAASSVRRMNQLIHPGKTIMLFERMTNMSSPYATLAAYQFSSSWSFANGWFSGGGPRLSDGSCYHGNTMNFSFADGHVESLEPEATYTPNNLWEATD
jgi:prepilin-type N-terminal cleavage/methylation domain-containing protein/prepilin-type processing-associated H-X9-DG protein